MLKAKPEVAMTPSSVAVTRSQKDRVCNASLVLQPTSAFLSEARAPSAAAGESGSCVLVECPAPGVSGLGY